MISTDCLMKGFESSNFFVGKIKKCQDSQSLRPSREEELQGMSYHQCFNIFKKVLLTKGFLL